MADSVFWSLSTYFGAFCIVYLTIKFSLKLLSGLYTFFIAKSLGLTTNLKRYGKWAVVTGSTDGIGKAYAQELARRGLNIVLISRSPDKLAATAEEIGAEYPDVEVKTISADFSKGQEIYENIRLGIAGLEIGVLVNNVGVSYMYPEYMLDVPKLESLGTTHLNVNCLSMVRMTEIVLPQMVQRRRGAIINISSAAGLRPLPLLTVYSATKAFTNFFSRALHQEYKDAGVFIQCISPYYVVTKMSGLKRDSLFMPLPERYARSCLDTVGLASDTTGYWPHGIQDIITDLLPLTLLYKGAMIFQLGIRDRIKRKLNKQQQERKEQ